MWIHHGFILHSISSTSWNYFTLSCYWTFTYRATEIDNALFPFFIHHIYVLRKGLGHLCSFWLKNLYSQKRLCKDSRLSLNKLDYIEISKILLLYWKYSWFVYLVRWPAYKPFVKYGMGCTEEGGGGSKRS